MKRMTELIFTAGFALVAAVLLCGLFRQAGHPAGV